MRVSLFGRVWVAARCWVQGRGRHFCGYLVFVSLAAMLWYLHKLTRDYTLTVDLPLRFDMVPSGVLLEGSPFRTVSVRLRGRGYSLLRYRYAGWFSPDRVDLRELWSGLSEDETGARVLYRAQLSGLVAGLLPTTLTLESVLTDAIALRYDARDSGYRPVSLRLDYGVSPQHTVVGGVRLSPDSVRVVGDASALRGVDTIFGVPLRLGELRGSAMGRVSLTAPSGVSVWPDEVFYRVEVSRFTEYRQRVRVELDGLPDTLRATLMPPSVDLVCNVPVESYAGMRGEWFRASARYSAEVSGGGLLVHLSGLPSGVFNVDFSPKRVGLYVERTRDSHRDDEIRNHRADRQWQELRGR